MTDTTDINLSGQELTKLPADFVEKHGSTCTRLDLTENKITSGEGFAGLEALETLILDKNGIEELSDWPRMPSLKTLWLNNNSIHDINETLEVVSRKFPSLTYLSMLKNPAVPNMYFSDGEAEAYQRHRYMVIYTCKQLNFLDATPISPEERAEAEKKGKFLKVARPKTQSSKTHTEHKAKKQAEPKRAPVKEHRPQTASFLAKGRSRYDGSNSEGNRFIVNDDL